MVTTAKVTTDSETLAVDLSECRAILRMDEVEAADENLSLIIQAATRQIEDLLDRSFLNKTFTVYLDRFSPTRDPHSDFWYQNVSRVSRTALRAGGMTITLPRAPLVSITSLKYTNSAGVLTTVPTSDYQVDSHNEPGRIAPSAAAVTWPSDVGEQDYLNPVEIIFVAGYGTESTDVPYRLRHAIIMLTGHYWENPEATTGMPLQQLDPGLWSQISDYKIHGFGA